MNIFKELVAEEKQHQKFKMLKKFPNERKILEKMVEGFYDRDNDIIKKFQTSYHEAFWEFYLFGVFKELGFKVDFSKNRPDFIIESPFKMNIEAVVSNIKDNGEKEETRTLQDVLPHKLSKEKFKEIIDEGIIRNSNALNGKKRKLDKEYNKLEWVKDEEPFIIALGAYNQKNYGKEFYFTMLPLLYGAYSDECIIGKGKKEKFIIKKETGAKIDIGLFEKEEYSNVSAVIYSCTATFGKLSALHKSEKDYENFIFTVRHDIEYDYYPICLVSKDNPEEIGDGLFVFHNPKAKQKLDRNLFNKKGIVQVWMNDDSNLEIRSESLPLLVRYNTTENILLGKMYEKQTIDEVFKTYNPDLRTIQGKFLGKNNEGIFFIEVDGECYEIVERPELKELMESVKKLKKGDKVIILSQVCERTQELISFIKIEK